MLANSSRRAPQITPAGKLASGRRKISKTDRSESKTRLYNERRRSSRGDHAVRARVERRVIARAILATASALGAASASRCRPPGGGSVLEPRGRLGGVVRRRRADAVLRHDGLQLRVAAGVVGGGRQLEADQLVAHHLQLRGTRENTTHNASHSPLAAAAAAATNIKEKFTIDYFLL